MAGNPNGSYILLTGGTGYIGSHTAVCLLEAGFRVAILDNLLNSCRGVIDRIETITGHRVPLHVIDLLDKDKVMELFSTEKFDGVVNFAGLKAVGESVSNPLWYYHNNLTGMLNLLDVMNKTNCKTIVFSSSATVYQPSEEPLQEHFPLGPSNPYGQTKFMIEQMLQDLYVSDNSWAISILRYFNPVGAHPSGIIGESPSGIPNNLMPYVQQVAVGRREKLTVHGNDYKTKDGTGVRDFIHVDDLADGHRAALVKLLRDGSQCMVHNLGTGNGYSVMDMVNSFRECSGREIPYTVGPRRPGDLATVVCKPDKANTELQWKATRDLETMCSSGWKWQSQNPTGYPADEDK